MKLRVDLLPRGSSDPSHQAFADTVLVVDVIRATTTAISFLERGAESLYLTSDLETALAFKAEGVILAGERRGLKPEGFDLGNSPFEVLEQRFDGKTIVMTTTNGTLAAANACETGKNVILACLRNAHAAAIMAVARSQLPYLDLVPYFDRLCFRPLTPLASSVPRTMW